MMTNRQRILAVLDGQRPDRLPWVPRLKIWYQAHRNNGTLPARYRGWSLRAVERDVFGGTAARDAILWREQLRDVEIRVHRPTRMDTVTQYITPVGTVSTRFRTTDCLQRSGIQDAQVEYLIKRPEDYPVVEYLVEHTQYREAYDEYQRYEEEVGEDGYPMVNCGDCPFHHWLRGLVGYGRGYYHLCDHAGRVERLLGVLSDRFREQLWPLMLDSPARLLMHGHHFSSQMTPPPLFEQFILPYYQQLSAQMCARGKILALHADNDTRAILNHIERAGFGLVDCLATAPMVPTTLAEARAAWGKRVIIFGGIPSVILEEPYSDAEFEQYLDELFRTIAPGDAFLLAVADNAMPGAKIERLKRITQLVDQRGRLPLR